METIAEKSRTKEIIDRLQSIMDAASPVPLASGKVMIYKDEVQSLLTELTGQIDMELKTYHEVNDRRGKIINEAKKEAERIIYQAEHTASRVRVNKRTTNVDPVDFSMLTQEELDALDNANEIYGASLIYTDEMLTEVSNLITETYESFKSDYEIVLKVMEEKIATLANNRSELMDGLQEMDGKDRSQQILEIGQLLSNELFNARVNSHSNPDLYDDGSMQLTFDLKTEQELMSLEAEEKAKEAQEAAREATEAVREAEEALAEMTAERDALLEEVSKMKRENRVAAMAKKATATLMADRSQAGLNDVRDEAFSGQDSDEAGSQKTDLQEDGKPDAEYRQEELIQGAEIEEERDADRQAGGKLTGVNNEDQIIQENAGQDKETLYESKDEALLEDDEEYEIVYVTEDELEEGEEYEIIYVDEDELEEGEEYEIEYVDEDEIEDGEPEKVAGIEAAGSGLEKAAEAEAKESRIEKSAEAEAKEDRIEKSAEAEAREGRIEKSAEAEANESRIEKTAETEVKESRIEKAVEALDDEDIDDIISVPLIPHFNKSIKIATVPSEKVSRMAAAITTDKKYSGLISRAVQEKEKSQVAAALEDRTVIGGSVSEVSISGGGTKKTEENVKQPENTGHDLENTDAALSTEKKNTADDEDADMKIVDKPYKRESNKTNSNKKEPHYAQMTFDDKYEITEF